MICADQLFTPRPVYFNNSIIRIPSHCQVEVEEEKA
jgi:hypothetical protein